MAKLIVSRAARDDLAGIQIYIRDELLKADAFVRIMRELKKAIESLRTMPERGKNLDSVLSVHTEFRFLICGNYRIFYLSDGETVEVVRVLHMLQDFMCVLFDRYEA